MCHGFDQKKLIKEKYLGMAIKDERYIKVLVNDIEKNKKALIHENTIKNYFQILRLKYLIIMIATMQVFTSQVDLKNHY